MTPRGLGPQEDGSVDSVDALLARLKLQDARSWMTVTNARGELVPRALQKLCAQRDAAGASDGERLSALLQRVASGASPAVAAKAPKEAEALYVFDRAKESAEFVRKLDAKELSFEDWLTWEWLDGKVGPPGSSAVITHEAALLLWSRVVSRPSVHPALAGVAEFVELAQTVQHECRRATAIQATLRGRMGRRSVEEARGEVVEGRLVAEKLAPFNPTPPCAVEQALDALAVGPGDVLYDLGCGDGRLLVAAALRGARAVGVEYEQRFVERARQAAAEAAMVPLIEVLHADACSVDLAPATKIFVYLVPAGLRLVAPALHAALARGVPIASYTFSLPELEPLAVLTSATRAPECKVFVYRGCAGAADDRASAFAAVATASQAGPAL